jgi:hypothetical protein
MGFRKLRIAWSVAWGAVAALLCVLWVWSYWSTERMDIPVPTTDKALTIASFPGAVGVRYGSFTNRSARPWDLIIRPSKPYWSDRSKLGVYYKADAISFTVEFAYWLIALCAICTSAMPRLRFSLRTLLIATTLVAVVLGLIVWCLQ